MKLMYTKTKLTPVYVIGEPKKIGQHMMVLVEPKKALYRTWVKLEDLQDERRRKTEK